MAKRISIKLPSTKQLLIGGGIAGALALVYELGRANAAKTTTTSTTVTPVVPVVPVTITPKAVLK